MNRRNTLASLRLAVAIFTLSFIAQSQASLLDCARVPGIKSNLQGDCIGGESHLAAEMTGLPETDSPPPLLAAPVIFQVKAVQTSTALSGSLPLVVFFAGLIGVLLVRAKSYNSK